MRSFIPVHPRSHFSIHNLPYGVFTAPNSNEPRIGVAIGDYVLDMRVFHDLALFEDDFLNESAVFAASTLNPFMALGREKWRAARRAIQRQLQPGEFLDHDTFRSMAFHHRDSVTMHLPVDIGDYTDFYSSREHATNVGALFRGPENALPENWLHMPLAYHGRASSVVVGGTNVIRPNGQIRPDGDGIPRFGPTGRMDFELEVGMLIGPGNAHGEPIAVGDAWHHIFGLVLVNDWSARDIQQWEYRPLGPFNGKNSATSISPWVVTLEALEPFLVDGPTQEPPPLPYLRGSNNRTYDIELEVSLRSATMPQPHTVCRSNFRHLYWNMCQQIAHHTASGCNLRPGDLLASGTISGPTPDSAGSLLELTRGGAAPLTLPNGESRTFLADGDQVTMSGYCQGDGYRVGFGRLVGTVLPARTV